MWLVVSLQHCKNLWNCRYGLQCGLRSRIPELYLYLCYTLYATPPLLLLFIIHSAGEQDMRGVMRNKECNHPPLINYFLSRRMWHKGRTRYATPTPWFINCLLSSRTWHEGKTRYATPTPFFYINCSLSMWGYTTLTPLLLIVSGRTGCESRENEVHMPPPLLFLRWLTHLSEGIRVGTLQRREATTITITLYVIIK